MDWIVILGSAAAGLLMGLLARVTVLLATCVLVLVTPFIPFDTPAAAYAHYPFVLIVAVVLQVSYLLGATLPQVVSGLQQR